MEMLVNMSIGEEIFFQKKLTKQKYSQNYEFEFGKGQENKHQYCDCPT